MVAITESNPPSRAGSPVMGMGRGRPLAPNPHRQVTTRPLFVADDLFAESPRWTGAPVLCELGGRQTCVPLIDGGIVPIDGCETEPTSQEETATVDGRYPRRRTELSRTALRQVRCTPVLALVRA